MLKFFRKIRQKFLSENRISKYSIYALGEIILVVIGILIALQINNWNEQTKTNQKQRNYLGLIKTEMTNNLKALDSEKLRLNQLLEGLREFVYLRDQSSSEINEKNISSAWGKAFSKTIMFKSENGALTELISSGVLKEISNDTIRNVLASWESKMQKLRSQEREISSYIKKGNEYLEKNGNVRIIIDNNGGNKWWQIDKLSSERSNKFLLKSQEFENIVVFGIGTGQALSDGHYDTMKQDILSIISIIENELSG